MEESKLKVLFSNYHISVNAGLVDDLLAIGLEVLLPHDRDFAPGRIDFFAPNTEHKYKEGARIIGYDEFMHEEPMAILVPCIQHVEDFHRLYRERGEKDVLVYLPANSNAIDHFPLDGSDYVMAHDLWFYRQCKAKYKMMYFNRPLVLRSPKNQDELKKSFEQKALKLYINNFDREGYEPEYEDAQLLRERYARAVGWRIPFYGYGMPDGWPSMKDVQDNMVNSMFTVVFKRRETWGQMVNESMLLGTPCIFLKEYINSTFTQYLITPETALICDSIDEIVERVTSMTWGEYQTLVNESFYQSNMFCDNNNRRQKLSWLFEKVKGDPKISGLKGFEPG